MRWLDSLAPSSELRRSRLRAHLPSLGCVALALAAFGWHASFFDTYADDAYITFRYSQNLARGVGAVWNAGERVEGYSNFLWMALLAIVHRIVGATLLPVVARIGSFLCACGVIVVVFALVRRITRSLLWGTVSAMSLAFASSFAAHARNGLESSAFALLIMLVAWAMVADSPRLLAASLLGVSLCRFEGVLIAAIAGGGVLLTGITSRAGRSYLRAALAWVPLYALWNVWRYAYYGFLLPNSVAAKQGRSDDARFIQGIGYVRSFFQVDTVVTVLALSGLVAIVILLARRRKKPVHPAFVFLVLVAGVYTAFVVWIGGCWMPAWRMMAHVTPAFVAVGTIGLSVVASLFTMPSPRLRWIGRVVVIATTGAAGVSQVREHSRKVENFAPRITYWRDQVFALGEMGAWLRDTLPKNTLVATFAAGALPYYADRIPCLDVLGLTDTHIARFGHKDPNGVAGHVSTDWAYVLARKPDIYVSTAGGGFSASPILRSDSNLRGPYVAALFEFKKTKNPQGRFVTLMVRADKKDELFARLQSRPGVVLVRSE